MVTVTNAAIEFILFLVFVSALVRYLRTRESILGEISLMLGALSGSLILTTLGQMLHATWVWWSVFTGCLFLAQPYFLTRLAGRLTPSRRLGPRLSAAGLFFSWVIFISGSGHLHGILSLVVIAYFLGSNFYASLVFLRAARRTGGAVRRRMRAIAVGTGLFVVALILLTAASAFGAYEPWDRLGVSILILMAGTSFMMGFTPPGWLSRRWQLPEISRFLQGAPGVRDVGAVLDHLVATALGVTGGKAGGAALVPSLDQALLVRWQVRDGEEPPESSLTVPDQGVLFEALTLGHPGWSRTLDHLPESFQTWARALGIREVFALPITGERGRIGVLLVLPDTNSLFAREDIELLEHMARQTAVAVENAILLAETERQAQHLSTINRVTTALIRPLDPDVLSREILESLSSVCGADVSELFLLEPGETHLGRVARRPPSPEALHWPVGTGLPAVALDRGAPVFSADAQEDPRFLRHEEAVREGYRSFLAVPLLSAGRKVGVATLIHRSHHTYSDDELQLLMSLAAPAATALENATLFKTAERRLGQFESIHESAVALAAELSMDQLMAKVVDAARSLVGARYAALSVLDERSRGPRFVTSGLSDDERGRLGEEPTGKGLLGLVDDLGAPVRVADISSDPRSAGFPEGHPVMGSYLGVPITYAGEVLGRLYAADKLEAPEFSPEDEKALSALAAHIAVAITNTRLFTQIDESRASALKANEELAEASRAKSDFLASMSHELRTPLNAILGFTELMLDDELRIDAAKRRHYMETVHESGRHLLGLINDILDLSKVEAGRMDLHTEVFDAMLAIQEVLMTVKPLAERGGIRLEVEAGEPCPIWADRGKIKQILYNLVSNGIKFTPEGGQVSVLCRRVDDELQLTVADTGVGIAPKDQERIFDAFQQLDSSIERRHQGTGLGLALVKRFVELHGGRIKLESVPSKGSRFHVFLPLRSDDKALPPSFVPDSGPDQADVPLILVVEDDPRAATLLRHILEREGFRVEVTPSGEEVVTKARALHPAAITLDVMLPGIQGWSVLEALKGDEDTRNVPVVVVTIVDDPHTAYALGATDFFLKPVDRVRLIERLSHLTFTTKVKTQRIQVLSVDDDQDALGLVRAILEPEGFIVLEALDGRRALEIARSEHPDLILLDLMMPEMNGFEVLEELRAKESTQDIPVLVITARELSPEDQRRLNGHVLTVLHKGAYAKTDLVDWLNTAVGRRPD